MWNATDSWDLGPGLAHGAAPYRALVDNLDQCVFLLDADGRHVAANASFCRWLEKAEADVLGRTVFDLWPPVPAARFAADGRRARAGERVERDEQLPRGRQTRDVRLVQTPVRNEEDDSVGGVLGMFRDMTDERAREDRLRQAHQLESLGRLAGGVAHDLNNLLTVLHVNLPLVREALPPASPQRELVAVMENTARLAADLTGQLRTFVRRDARRREPVDLNAALADVVKVLGRAVDPRVRIEVRPRPGLAPVPADPGQVAQVLLNLCLNACDAMPGGGRLALETDELTLGPGPSAGTFACLRVRDTGEGMTPEVRARAFEAFFTTKRPGKGTGLGLAIVHDVARQHGGWVECSSTPGAGTCFTVYLSVSPVAQSAPPRRGGGTATILLVDDDRSIRVLARTVLEKNGYRVLLAKDGRQAVETCRRERERIAMILLDQSAPVRCGPQALADALDGLRAVDPDARVLLASGSSPQDLPPAARHCVRGYLPKPYRADNLLCAVQGVLGRG